MLFSLLGLIMIHQPSWSQHAAAVPEPQKIRQLRSLLSEVNAKWEQKQIRSDAMQRARVAETHPSDTTLTLRLMGFSPTGEPIYYQTYNLFAAQSLNTHQLWSGGMSELNLNGEGITLHVWDGGTLRHTHQEFAGRTTQMDTGGFMNGHATHVSGTMVAAGVVPTARGMAPQANLHAYTFANDEEEMIEAAANGALLSNHSYGRPTGWLFHTNQWWWYGDTRISEVEDYKFGFYTDETRIRDEITYLAPFYLQVHAAGNDRLDVGPAPGQEHNVFDHTIGEWVKSTTPRLPDGGPDGFDCISTLVLGKNVLTIGSVADASNYQGPESVLLSEFSSTGPTDDGRIKPDLVAKGQGLLSTWVDNNSSYAGLSGTSMAAPSITGSLALLQQLNHRLYGNYLRASTVKALAIHTAREAGTHPGPDYRHGWGLADIQAAALILPEKDNTTLIQERNLVQNTVPSYTRTVYASGSQPLVATLVWTDVPAQVPEPALNDRTPMLVNDLDLRITRLSDGHVFYPWKLDPDNPANAATTGDNLVDNVEKIQIMIPEPGQYEIKVTHKGTLVDPINTTNKRQSFSLVVSGIAERVVDLAVTNANVSVSGCSFTDQTPAFIRVANNGQQDAQNVLVNFEVKDAGQNIVSQGSATIDLLPAGQSLEVDVLLNLTQGFDFTFTASVNHPGDQLPVNNTFVRNLVSDSWQVNQSTYHTSFEGIVYLDQIGWQTVNNNQDNAGWMLRIASGPNAFASDGANSMRYGILNPSQDGTDVEGQADDWLISTCMYLMPGDIYRLSFDYRAWNAGHPEKMRVLISQSDSPGTFTEVLLDLEAFSNEEFLTAMPQFTVEQEGSYFLAFHVYSDPDHRFVYLDNVFVERMVFNDMAVSSIEVDADGCDFSAQTPVVVTIANMGLEAQEDFLVQLQVQHLPSQTTHDYFISVEQEILPEEFVEITFLADMSQYGKYVVSAITLLPGDERPENDALTIEVTNTLADLEVNSFFTSFDDIINLSQISWTIVNVDQNTYSWRFYSTPGQAYSPPNSINYYRQPGSEASANDWLITNCLLMQQDEYYRIRFYTATKGTGNKDEYRLMLMSGTQPQDSLFSFGHVQVQTFDYVHREYVVQAPYTGVFYIGFFVNTTLPDALQMFVDDVTIEKVQEKDAAVVELFQQTYGCNAFTDPVPVGVAVKNRGTLMLEDAQILLTVSAPDLEDALYSLELPAALELGQIDTLLFHVDLSHLNTIYEVKAQIVAEGDENPDNDEKVIFIRNTTVDLTAGQIYFNDFELVHIDGGSAPVDPRMGWSFENANNDFYSDGSPISWVMRKNAPFAYSGLVSMRTGRSTVNQADDWLFSNCFVMQEGENYLLNFWYTGRAAANTEKMKVFLGSDQSSETMTELLWDQTFNTALNYQQATITLSPPSGGTWYIGFYHYSDPDQGWIYLDDFSIQRNYDLDLALDSIRVLETVCNFSEATPARISFKNTGNAALDYPVTVNWQALDPQGNITSSGSETWEGVLQVNEVVYLDVEVDLRKYGLHTLQAEVTLPAEANEILTVNNSKTLKVRNTSMFPDVENIYLTFEEYESISETNFSVLDLNQDGFTWDLGTTFTNFAFSGRKVFYYSFSASNDANDWLFSSCANLSAQTVYTVSYHYRVFSGDYPENMTFAVATAPDPNAVIQLLDVKEEMDNYNYRRVTYAFTVPEDGQYYFGWRAFSPKYHRFIFLDDFALRVASDIDGGVYSITADVGSCDFGSDTPITAVVTNLGSQPLPAGNLSMVVSNPNGASQSLSLATPSIPVLGKAEVPFEADITNQARYSFHYNLQIEGDQQPGNNQGVFTLHGSRVDLSAPGNWFIQDFETIFALREVGWSIHNLNNDNRYWGLRVNDPPLAHSGHNYLVYFTGNQTQAANDWVISGCYELSSELRYKAAFFYRLGSGSHNLKLAVGNDSEPQNMTQVIWQQTGMTAPSDQPYMHVGAEFEVTQSGRYFFGIQQFSAAGQGSSLADDLVVIAQPKILPFDGPMETGSQITLQALGSDSLRWYADEALTLQIGQGTSLTLTVDTDDVMPVYAAEFVYGVMGPSDLIFIGPAVGVDEKLKYPVLSVYPNPTSGILYLDLPAGEYKGKVQLRILTMLGETVLEYEFRNEANILKLDVSTLQPGSYIISLQGPDQKHQGRFVKLR